MVKSNINFLTDKNALNIPWVESPLFDSICENLNLNDEDLSIAKNYNKYGYVIIDLNLDDTFIQLINNDINNKVSEGKIKKNPKIYHYNESPRIVEAWKFSKNIAKLSLNRLVIEKLQMLYDRKPVAISSLNFIKGTEQPLHSDYMHFSTIPEKFLAGAWVALEDTNSNNGPLLVVPKSHKLPIIDFKSLRLDLPNSMISLKECYSVYEDYVKSVIIANNLETKEIHLKKGQTILWAANLLHGGTKTLDNTLTRKSQVTHYHFEKCEYYYNPGFSDPFNSNYALRDIEELEIKL